MIYNQKVGLPIYSLTGFFVCFNFFRVNYYEKEGIKNNLSASLWRRFPLFKYVFKLGLFGRMQGAFLFVGRRDCSRRRFFRTAEDESPYSEKTSVYFLSYQKSVAGSGTQPQVSRRLFCFFFLRLKKEDISYSRGRKSLQKPSPSAIAATHTLRARL